MSWRKLCTQDVEGDQGLAAKGGAVHPRCMKRGYNASFARPWERWIDIAPRCSTTPRAHRRELVMGLVERQKPIDIVLMDETHLALDGV